MSARSERQQAREAVAAYHGAALAKLVAHVAEAIDRFREGELDAFEVDDILIQYSHAAKELWKFCNMTNIEFAASLVQEEQPSIDWWERGDPRGGERRPSARSKSRGLGALRSDVEVRHTAALASANAEISEHTAGWRRTLGCDETRLGAATGQVSALLGGQTTGPVPVPSAVLQSWCVAVSWPLRR